jgi:hypothetical protein
MDDQGPPNLSIGPIEIWTNGRLPNPTADPWWVDEIVCRVSMRASGVQFDLRGEIPSRNFQFFLPQLQLVYDNLEGTAQLDGSDLGLIVGITALSQGQMSVAVEFLPFGVWEGALRANFRLDQTHLRPMLSQCRAILQRFPVKADRSLL